MIRRPPRFTRTDTLFTYTTLFRSLLHMACVICWALCADKSRPCWWAMSCAVLSAGWPTSAARPAECTVLSGKCCLSRSEEHTSELQSLMRISYAVFCLKKKTVQITITKKQNETYTTQEVRTH